MRRVKGSFTLFLYVFVSSFRYLGQQFPTYFSLLCRVKYISTTVAWDAGLFQRRHLMFQVIEPKTERSIMRLEYFVCEARTVLKISNRLFSK